MNRKLSILTYSFPFEGKFAVQKMYSLSPRLLEQLTKEELFEIKSFRNEERKREFATSRLLLKQLANEWGIAETNFIIRKNELGNPFAKVGDDRYQLSIAHTDEEVFCGLTRTKPIGVDLEPINRKVSERLRPRMMHPIEKEQGLEVSALRLWTIKEAYIKLRGEGLRLNMNDVYVQEEENHFSVKLNDDKKAKICSFNHQNNWLAIAFYL